jgi:hypothetical protein
LVNQLLALLEGRLPKVRRDLRCRVVHELAVLAKHVLRAGAPSLLLLLLLRVRAGSVAAMLRRL